ncbi:Methyl-accepting chemotaxis protein [Candidatus Rhodobacter oscarellae]|uniref:Methyl-accepting chemotaxis protein n=1 Tax=Candidatus Rhodobacter oscarellae TaxID=1675527 RepID=A0A0J9EDA1_9RHOB|nr:methyl-accepting chemotaxis protein [Candidatus Rhodobacter lobularis]KMW60685.1 Methyl-accepting chemotaxis protein [Candidatus Rhodobacter lobularis]
MEPVQVTPQNDTHAQWEADARAASMAAPKVNLTPVIRQASKLGYEVVDVSGFLDALSHKSQAQLSAVELAKASADRVTAASASVGDLAQQVAEASSSALGVAQTSATAMRESSSRSAQVAQWVGTAADQIEAAVGALSEIEKNNDMVRGIATQISFLSINARIEATRAGEEGRQFRVIADAVNELSARTNEVANEVRQNISSLSDAISQLAEESQTVRGDAEQVIKDNDQTDAALGEIAAQINQVNDQASLIQQETGNTNDALAEFSPAFRELGESIQDTAGQTEGVTKRGHALIDLTEGIVQECVSLGGETADSAYIERVQADAARLSAALQHAVDSGRITQAQLFSRDYRPIQGTNPEQFMTPFTELTDELFTPIQEEALTQSDAVVFCAAVNVDGHLPTHNKKFAKPQGSDPDWNAGNCRNRRMFNDRVGLKAGQSTKPFLLQVYRRDMGGGVFKLMKDVSAPITVNGKHWGGLRLAYSA